MRKPTYHVSVTVTYGAFVSAASEEAAKAKALDMDFEDMIMDDDVSVDVLKDERFPPLPWSVTDELETVQ